MIRPITQRDDLTRVAEIIYATDPFLFPYIFGKGDAAIGKIEALVAMEHNSFSYRYIHGMFEGETLLGLYIAYSAQEKSKDEDFNKVFKGLKGLWLGLKLLPIANLLNPPLNRTFYLQNLSVHESVRGSGNGKALLKDFYQLAIKKGHNTVSLDVALENTGAMRLYLNEGFQLIKKRRLLGLFPMMYYCEKKIQY